MKKLVTIFLFICISTPAFSTNIEGKFFGVFDDGKVRGYSSIDLTATTMVIEMEEDWYSGKPIKMEYVISQNERYGLNFLSTPNCDWMILRWPEGIFISDKNGTSFSFLTREKNQRTEVIDDTWVVSSSSFLKEQKNDYLAENMMSPIGLPWASGNGYGIGDTITIQIANRHLPMLFINGYVSAQKPYLFYENSRVLRMKISSINTKKVKVVLLEDGPKIQRVDIFDIISEKDGSDTLIIEILDVYKGNKYKDLCIKAIIPDFSKMM